VKFPLVPRYADYDTKGHVNNAVYLTYFEIAREKAWVAMGEGPDFSFVVAEATVKYLSQARIGDPLEIEILTDEVRNKAWVWRYRITDARDGRAVAEGATVQVMFDYETRKSTLIPDGLRARLADI
jgi:acyl-CoA thioester hydrolase